MGGTCRTHGNEEKCLQSFDKTPEGKNRFVRPRNRWEDDINVALKEIGCEVLGLIHLLRIWTNGGLLSTW
jgi:hypothetical protein